MHVPAALELWAAEHSDQLSGETVSEVRLIASALAISDLATSSIEDFAAEPTGLEELFPTERAERARTLLPIVAAWLTKRPAPETPDTSDDSEAAEADSGAAVAVEAAQDDAPQDDAVADDAVAGDAVAGDLAEPPAPAGPTFIAVPDPSADLQSELQPDLLAGDDDPFGSPAFLRSDRIDEEDETRLYGPRRPWAAILGSLLLLGLLAAGAILGWMWFQRSGDADPAEGADTAVAAGPTAAPTPAPAQEPTPAQAAPSTTEQATAVPTEAEPTPAPVASESFWADTTPILNSGSAEISSSTYVVSPSNRAVLTGHTAGITGIAISDDGRVLTSGADRRLVDWGADVTVASPDVLNVPAALTVLERTRDQRVIAGDLDGNITIIDLVDQSEPIVAAVHGVAISAASELSDGRLAVASVDGDVAVFAIETPDDTLDLPHDIEVTAIVGLPDSSVATAAVDGAIRIWPSDGSAFSQIETLGAPATALTLLADGRLAAASVTGDVQVFAPDGSGLVQLPGHVGAVRALREIDYPDGTRVLASGGDDTTVRVWDIAGLSQIRVLEGHGDIISGLDQLPDGRLVSTSGDGTGRVWDLTVPPNPPVIAPHDWNLSALHPWDNDQFVTGGVDGHVLLASTAETTRPQSVTQHDAPIVGLGVLQTGDIVSLDASSVLRINQSDGALSGLVELTLAPGATALTVRDALGIATGHADGTVRLHDFVEETAVIDAHGGGVNDIITLGTGLVVSAGQDNLVRVIDPEDASSVATFELHTTPVDVLAELPDGRVASASADGIYIWSVDGLAADHVRLNGPRGPTLSLVALPGGQLVSTGTDGRVRLWDLNTAEAEPETLIDIPGVVNPYLIQADNGLFVAGAARGYVVFTPS